MFRSRRLLVAAMLLGPPLLGVLAAPGVAGADCSAPAGYQNTGGGQVIIGATGTTAVELLPAPASGTEYLLQNLVVTSGTKGVLFGGTSALSASAGNAVFTVPTMSSQFVGGQAWAGQLWVIDASGTTSQFVTVTYDVVTAPASGTLGNCQSVSVQGFNVVDWSVLPGQSRTTQRAPTSQQR